MTLIIPLTDDVGAPLITSPDTPAQNAPSSIAPSSTATTEPAPTTTATATPNPYVGANGSTPSTYNGQTINDFLGGYSTSQLQGMTDAARASLLDTIRSNYQILANGSGLAGTGISGAAYDAYQYLVGLSQATPSIKTAMLDPAYLTPGDKSGNLPLLTDLGLSANFNPAGGTGIVDAPTSGTAVGVSSASPTQAAGASSTGDTGASGSGAPTDSTVNRLIDLIAAQYAGAGVSGGGSGFSGLLSAPIDGTQATDPTASAPAGNSKALLILGAVIVLALGFWYYKHHHKAK